MSTIDIGLKVSNNYGEKFLQLQGIKAELTKALQDATQDNLRILERETERAIGSIAGGVYWDVKGTYARESDGARVRVYTDKSRPHRIVPKDPNGWLHFTVNGREVFTKLVNHPGSRPVDWINRVATTSPDLVKANYYEEVSSVFGRLA